jgi:hypothetical protein
MKDVGPKICVCLIAELLCRRYLWNIEEGVRLVGRMVSLDDAVGRFLYIRSRGRRTSVFFFLFSRDLLRVFLLEYNVSLLFLLIARSALPVLIPPCPDSCPCLCPRSCPRISSDRVPVSRSSFPILSSTPHPVSGLRLRLSVSSLLPSFVSSPVLDRVLRLRLQPTVTDPRLASQRSLGDCFAPAYFSCAALSRTLPSKKGSPCRTPY